VLRIVRKNHQVTTSQRDRFIPSRHVQPAVPPRHHVKRSAMLSRRIDRPIATKAGVKKHLRPQAQCAQYVTQYVHAINYKNVLDE
jgi:hypothetical protein